MLDVSLYKQKLERFNASASYQVDLERGWAVLDRLTFDALLDVGCGTGYFMARVQRRYPATRVDGLDRHDFGAPRCTIADLSTEPLDGRGRYDVITLLHVVNHLADVARAFTFLCQMLRPGGHLLVINPEPLYLKLIRLLNEFRYLETQGGDATILQDVGAEQLRTLLAHLPLKLVEHERYGRRMSVDVDGHPVVILDRELMLFRRA